MTKLEEVARAICNAMGDDPDELGTLIWEASGPVPNWKFYVSAARSAVEALREPNTAMIEGGEALTHWSGTGSGCYCDHHAEPERVFPAMIDAILKEKPE